METQRVYETRVRWWRHACTLQRSYEGAQNIGKRDTENVVGRRRERPKRRLIDMVGENIDRGGWCDRMKENAGYMGKRRNIITYIVQNKIFPSYFTTKDRKYRNYKNA